MELPTELVARLHERALEPIGLGESGAGVWRCTLENATPIYLKTASIADELHLDREADRLRWMKAHDLPVPTVREYGRMGDTAFLLLEEVAGVPASDPQWASHLPELVGAIGRGLAVLHRTSIADCPFDQRIARQIDEVSRRIAAGHVNESDFDAIRAARGATELFAELLASVPDSEDLVFTHGDYCLPNIILRETRRGRVEMMGWIDCGRAGVADRYQDIALAVRSIAGNFGDKWVAPFLEAYGLPEPRREKLSFFALLDEFF
jgi:aminoglycoside 3'-phosphotransferase-2